MIGFTVTSLARGLAPGVGWLIAARALQGLAGSVMIPQGLALAKVVFPPDYLRRALIPIGPVMGVVTVAGPILAGWLLHLDLFGSQWRAIFLINVPIGVVAAALGYFVLPRRAGEDPSIRIDASGVGLITLASLLLIVPLVQGREYGWPPWTYLMLGGALVALALFVVSERRGRHPVLPPSLLRRRSFVVGLIITGGLLRLLHRALAGLQRAQPSRSDSPWVWPGCSGCGGPSPDFGTRSPSGPAPLPCC